MPLYHYCRKLATMLFNEDKSEARYQIHAYDSRSVTIGTHCLTTSCIVFADHLVTDVKPQTLNELTEMVLEPLFSKAPEILIIGSGNYHQFLSNPLRYSLETRNIGVECMTTPAACRSYTALLAEARNVAALLFLG